MKMKWIVLLSAFGMMAAAQAALVENFESYTPGTNVAVATGNVWTEGGGEACSIGTDGANQYLNITGGTASRAYTGLGETYSSGIVTAEFDFWIDSTINDALVGFGNTAGGTWSTFGPYAGVVGTTFRARNGGSMTNLATVVVDTEYSVKIEANVDDFTYDVFLDGIQVATNFAFRAEGPLSVVTGISNRSDAGNFAVDNLSVIPEPATLALVGIMGSGLLLFRRRLRM